MVIGIIGENCVGKSALANEIGNIIGARIITGRDYLRMAKSAGEATNLFKNKLKEAMWGEHIIYVISEKEHVALLPEGAVKILVVAEMEVIKERFKARMRGILPEPVEQMLEKKHGMFDEGDYDFKFDSTQDDIKEICAKVKSRV